MQVTVAQSSERILSDKDGMFFVSARADARSDFVPPDVQRGSTYSSRLFSIGEE